MGRISTSILLVLFIPLIQGEGALAREVDVSAAPAAHSQNLGEPDAPLVAESSAREGTMDTVESVAAEDQELSVLDLVTEKTCRYTGGGYREREFRYRLFVPEGVDGQERLPLLIWLHGSGESGDDNLSQLRHLEKLIFPPPRKKENYPFFFLAVQCPKDNPIWTTDSTDADDMLNVAMTILEDNCENYPIDLDRICVSGISSGGTAAWEIAIRHPNCFSAVAPISSAGTKDVRLQQLVNVPIWAFHSQRDQEPPISIVQQTVDAINEAGGTAELTAVNKSPTGKLWVHNAWTEAFGDYGLLEWLLAQRRGESASSPRWHTIQRQYINWSYIWPRSISIAILLVGVAAWRSEKRRKRASQFQPVAEGREEGVE